MRCELLAASYLSQGRISAQCEDNVCSSVPSFVSTAVCHTAYFIQPGTCSWPYTEYRYDQGFLFRFNYSFGSKIPGQIFCSRDSTSHARCVVSKWNCRLPILVFVMLSVSSIALLSVNMKMCWLPCAIICKHAISLVSESVQFDKTATINSNSHVRVVNGSRTDDSSWCITVTDFQLSVSNTQGSQAAVTFYSIHPSNRNQQVYFCLKRIPFLFLFYLVILSDTI